MILDRLLAALGVAVVAFGVVAVAVIQAFGPRGDVGAGILGVGAGALAALAAFVAVALLVEEFSGPTRWAVDAVGVGGLTLVVLAAVTYVDVVSLATTTAVAIGAVAAVLAFAGAWLQGQQGEREGPGAA